MRTVVRARIDEKTKNEAAAVLDAIGLTVSDAFRLMMVRIATEKRLPFDLLVPNEETIAAMEATRRGELVTVGDVDGPDGRTQCGRLGEPRSSSGITGARRKAASPRPLIPTLHVF